MKKSKVSKLVSVPLTGIGASILGGSPEALAKQMDAGAGGCGGGGCCCCSSSSCFGGGDSSSGGGGGADKLPENER